MNCLDKQMVIKTTMHNTFRGDKVINSSRELTEEIGFIKKQIKSIRLAIKTFRKVNKDTSELEVWLTLYNRILKRLKNAK